MPAPGKFVLHSMVKPPLPAGDYVLHGEQAVAGGPVAPYDGHVRIDSPRYQMPPDQILSTFPPANSQGAYSSRLPQIVLRRRTLPWERLAGAPAPADTPWLALVVIAEGEGQLSGEVPVGQCVTPGEHLDGHDDVATGTYLAVTKTVVEAVFPTKKDLPLLAHVREVDIHDTELALGDDDGWLAVVLANRLPQPGKRYLACLVNLEKQVKWLPDPKPPVSVFVGDMVVQDLRPAGVYTDPDRYQMGYAGKAPSEVLGSTAQDYTAVTVAPVASTPMTAMSTWESAPGTVEAAALSASAGDAYRVVRDEMKAGFRIGVEAVAIEPVYRFPVLAHWSFSCTDAGDFQSLMQNLDVGLLGTLPRPVERAPGAPPPPEPTRPPLEVAETGHIGLSHLTRRGESATAWFRGPLAPQLVARQQPVDGRLPLAHASDQIRRVVPDGREDLTYAAAFEIGRLLALAQPSIVAALLRWRQEQFGAERVRRYVEVIARGLAIEGDLFAVRRTGAELGPLLARQLLLTADDPVKVLGPSRPAADPGRPLEFVGGDLDRIVATGLGLDLDAIRAESDRLGVAAAIGTASVPIGRTPDEPILGGGDADHLRDALELTVSRLAAETHRAGRLDRLLRAADRATGRMP